MDICDFKTLEMILTTIRPNKIIHLAALSESESIMKEPFETIYINGVVACKICEILHIHKINCRLFNTCSSEMFKGHKDYLIHDQDKFFLPTYPYAYGKILSYSIIEYYRNKYGYSFSNGILFPTESKRRKGGFLMKKIKDHIEEWKKNRTNLKLGNLYSNRNMLYVEDVVDAIYLILNQDKGDNYVICGDENYLIIDIIISFYKQYEIDLILKDNFLLEKKSNDIVIEFEPRNGSEINLRGCSKKLKELGWKIKYSFNDIINNL